MSVVSGKVEEYDNVSYDGFDGNEVSSPVYIPFQNGDDQSACNHVTQIIPEIPTITLDDDEEEVVNQDEDDIAITNVVTKMVPDLFTTTNMSGTNEVADNKEDNLNDNIHNDDNLNDNIHNDDNLNDNNGEDTSISKIIKDKDSITGQIELNTGGGDGVPTNNINTNTNNIKLDTNNHSNKNTSINTLPEVVKKVKEGQIVDSDFEYRQMFNKKCHELIQQRCWRKRKRKRRRMKRMEERESGIIVISSDDNDSDDHFEYTSSSDDIDSKQPPCKLARMHKKPGSSEHITHNPNHLTPTTHNAPSVSNPAVTKSFENIPGNQADITNNDDLNNALNGSDSISSTDMSSEISLPDNENEDKKVVVKSILDVKKEENVSKADDVVTEVVCNGEEAEIHHDYNGDLANIQRNEKISLDNI